MAAWRPRVLPVLTLLLFLGLLAAPATQAEEPPTLTAKVLHSQSAYAAGGSYRIALELTVRPGFHINSLQPKDAELYPTSLTWQAPTGCSVGPPQFPTARSHKPSFAAQAMDVHDGRFLVRATLTLAKDIAPGPHKLVAKLEYQACDDQACLMPESLEVPVEVVVAPAGKPGQRLNKEIFK